MTSKPALALFQELDPATVLGSIGEAVYDWDIGADTLRWRPGAEKVMPGIDPALLARATAYDGLTGAGAGRAGQVLASREADDGSGVAYALRYALRTPESGLIWLEDTGRWFAGLDGRPARAHGAVKRIHPETDRASDPADIDPATGLLTRQAFLGRADRLVTNPAVLARGCVIAAVALPAFAEIRRDRGHEAAEELARTAARRLAATLRHADPLARLGDDRFVMLLSPCDTAALPLLLQRLSQAFAAPLPLAAGPLSIAIRAAASPVHEAPLGAAALLRQIDEKLDRPLVIRRGLPNTARPRNHDEGAEILAALNDRRLTLVYQPVAEAGSRAIAFHEALIRMRREGRGLLGAASIVPAAERLGLIHLIDHRALELACEALGARATAHLSLNVSPLTLADAEWLEHLEAQAALHPERVRRLTVEITETAAIADLDAARRIVQRIRSLGARVAIDDFGAGHTSFHLLRHLGADMVKIDGAFVQNLSRSPDDRFFVRTLIDAASGLGMRVVAEWVRDAETARMLGDWGVDYLQGEYVGLAAAGLRRPLPRARRLNSG